MHRNSCVHDRKDVLLLHYEELDPVHEALVRARIDECPECARYYASLVELDSLVPRQASTHPDDELMQAVRSATSRRIRGKVARTRRSGVARLVSPTVLSRIATGGLVVAASFVVGRVSVSNDDSNSLVPGGQTPGGETYAAVSGLTMDPVSGQVRIDVRTEGTSVIEGDVNDALVQTLLYDALLDRGNPVGRFRTLSLLAGLNSLVIQPDPVLVGALSSILEDETNMGLKLQAARALRRILGSTPIQDDLRTVLVDIVETSDNDALRIEVLEILTEGEIARQDLKQILDRVTKDDNRFIRNRALNVLSTLISLDNTLENLKNDDSAGSGDTLTQPLEKIDG